MDNENNNWWNIEKQLKVLMILLKFFFNILV